MPDRTDLLVVGAGPYAYAAAACAREHGIRTRVVGRPMGFWRDQMPAGMFLRSGPDWHLDAAGEHTLEAYFEHRGLRAEEHTPIPVPLYLDHADWFRREKGIEVDERLVDALTASDDGFVATMADGSTITAEKVLAAPGIRAFVELPTWAQQLPPGQRAHTSDLVVFSGLEGARVVVVGGRQSAYEWAALLCDHGAASVDVVHRHAVPTFEAVSWAFVDPYVEQTLATRGWWRSLGPEARTSIGQEFWQAGRLTLEPWLLPRLRHDVVTSHPFCEVVEVVADDTRATPAGLTLSDGTRLTADLVVLATGYRADITAVPYLAPLLDRLAVDEGFPHLSEGFETSVPGLFVTGFASTRDFGPFFGFTKGCPAAATMVVTEMLR
jgi:cation diffusion facilitator CzcD-associated flavoprotein CzcO